VTNNYVLISFFVTRAVSC